MSTQLAQFTPFRIPQEKQRSMNLSSVLKKYLYHWPLFLIGLSLAAVGVFTYYQVAKPVYEIKATLLIQNEKKTADQQSPLHEIDLLSTNRIMENEFEILKSKQLIGEVVRDLKLDVVYQKMDGLATEDLYKNSPVKLTLINPTGNYSSATINLVIIDQNSFFVSMPDGNLKQFSFKETFKNNFGSWKLEPTPEIAEFKGAKIRIILHDPDALAIQYQKRIGVALSSKSSTAAVLSISDQVAQRGKDILNRLIQNYKVAGILVKKQETRSTLDFIDSRLTTLASELNSAEKGIETFKSSRGLTDLSSDSKISLENMQANDTRLSQVNVQLSIIEGIERYINSSLNAGKTPSTLGIDDPALSSLIEKLAQLQLQRERLLATTPETNPDFEPINRSISITKAAIKENVASIRLTLQNTQEKLQSFNDNFLYSIKNIPVQERQFINIKRQQAIKEGLYTYLLQKKEEVSVSYASALANDRIVDEAYAGAPKSALKAMIFAIALFLGMAFPAGLIYARGVISPKVNDLQELKDSGEIPIIGELPYEPSKSRIAISGNSATAISEQFRALRIKMYYLFGQKESGRVTLVTSSVAGEGKTYVSSNLGVAMAYSGRKTVLVELDLRKPKLAEVFEIDIAHPGITDFLNGKASVDEIIQNSRLEPTLDVIGSGTLAHNPSELLERQQLADLIMSLRDIYDDVIIDSPPVHLVPDAMIISRVADMTLYMIRQGYTKADELEFVKELNKQNQLVNINIIFNSIQRIRYGYGYNYDNNYYNSKKPSLLSTIFGNFTSRF